MGFSKMTAFFVAVCLQTALCDFERPLSTLERPFNGSGSNVLKDPSARLSASDRSLLIRRGSFLLMEGKSVLAVGVRSALRLETLSVLSLAAGSRFKMGDDDEDEDEGDGISGDDSVFQAVEMSQIMLDDRASRWLIDHRNRIQLTGSQVSIGGRWSIAVDGGLTAGRSTIRVNRQGTLTVGPRSRFRLTDARLTVASPYPPMAMYAEADTIVTIGRSTEVTLPSGSSLCFMRGNVTTAAESIIHLGLSSVMHVVGSLHISERGRIFLGTLSALTVGFDVIGWSWAPGPGVARLVLARPNLRLQIGPMAMLAVRTGAFCALTDRLSIFDEKLILDAETVTTGLNITCFDSDAKLDTFLATI